MKGPRSPKIQLFTIRNNVISQNTIIFYIKVIIIIIIIIIITGNGNFNLDEYYHNSILVSKLFDVQVL